MGKEYVRDNQVLEAHRPKNIIFHDDFRPLGRTEHPFTHTGGTAINKAWVIQSLDGCHVSSPNAFWYGSTPTTGGTVYAQFYSTLKDVLSKYKLSVRFRAHDTTDDADFNYIQFDVVIHYMTGGGAVRLQFASIRYYSNAGATEEIQYRRDTGAWVTINEFYWTSFDVHSWKEFSLSFDPINAVYLNITSGRQSVDFLGDNYPNILYDIAGSEANLFEIRTQTDYVNTGADQNFFIDEMTLEEI